MMNDRAAARMNAMEETGELYLGTSCRLITKDLYRTIEFEETFLRNPCKGCGSEHTLLREIGEINDIPQYDYRCNVIDHLPLYRNNNPEQIKVQFRLRVTPFVSNCGYDLDQAMSRLATLRRSAVGDHEAPEIYDSFINEVRKFCVEEEVRRLRG